MDNSEIFKGLEKQYDERFCGETATNGLKLNFSELRRQEFERHIKLFSKAKELTEIIPMSKYYALEQTNDSDSGDTWEEQSDWYDVGDYKSAKRQARLGRTQFPKNTSVPRISIDLRIWTGDERSSLELKDAFEFNEIGWLVQYTDSEAYVRLSHESREFQEVYDIINAIEKMGTSSWANSPEFSSTL